MSVVIDGTSGITFPDASSQSAAAASGYPAQAWVNFNGTGTVAIRADGNVSSITDHGTGDYTVTFSSALTDASYAATTTRSGSASSSYVAGGNNSTAPTTSAYRIYIIYPGVSAGDDSIVAVDVNR